MFLHQALAGLLARWLGSNTRRPLGRPSVTTKLMWSMPGVVMGIRRGSHSAAAPARLWHKLLADINHTPSVWKANNKIVAPCLLTFISGKLGFPPFWFGMRTPPQRNNWKPPSQGTCSKSHLLTSKATQTLNISNLFCCKLAKHEEGRRDEKADIRKKDTGRNPKV